MSSSTRREDRRARDDAYWNEMVRRMVNLPRNIVGGFSRAMDHGIDLLTINGDRRQQMYPPPPPAPSPPQQHSPTVHNDWEFLTALEQQYGTTHPFFYACRFTNALNIAKDERKLLFLYLHSPDYPFTPPFCKETLCSEVVVAFLDANFVSWGGIYDRGDGLQLGSSLRPASFPFCAVVASAPGGDNIAVLQQIEGPVSPSELVEILQRTMEEQGVAFGSSSRVKEEEKRRMDRRLREEQDAAYLAALKIDQEKERTTKLPAEKEVQKTPTMVTPPAGRVYNERPTNLIRPSKVKDATIMARSRTDRKQDVGIGKDTTTQVTQILIRFPNGERRKRSFSPTDKIQAIYNSIDSLGLAATVGNYRLISSFPRKVYGVDQMSMTLKDAGLHPKATLFLELL